MEDQGTGPFGQERGNPVDNIRGGVFGQEGSAEGGGVDVVAASLDVEEEGGDPESGSLKGPDLVCQGEAGVRGTKHGEGAALSGVEHVLGAGDGRESLTVMTRSRIFDTVWGRTIMRKDAGELYEAFPGLCRTMPFALFREGGWYPKATRGEWSSKRIFGFIRLIFFPTE